MFKIIIIPLMVLSIIISYFLYRYCFKNMDRIAKETAPTIVIIIFMLIPFFNILWGMFMYIAFVNKSDNLLNKFFRLQ